MFLSAKWSIYSKGLAASTESSAREFSDLVAKGRMQVKRNLPVTMALN